MILRKKGNDKSENKTKSKPKGHRTSRKGKKSHKKRKRSTGSCGKSVIFPHLVGFHSSRQNID